MEPTATAPAATYPVQFTPEAVSELARLMLALPPAPGRALRVGVKGGGCSGMTYVLDFDTAQPGDLQTEVGGVPIVLDPRHALYLTGMEVHYDSGLNARGFEFRNPNAKTTCGCGTSFSA